jgi:hypothetical protein
MEKKYREEGIETGIIDLQEFPIEQVIGGKYGEKLPEV